MIYNGYQVYPKALRARATGFIMCGERVGDIHRRLATALGDGEYLGTDEYSAAFLKNYQPLLDCVWKMMDNNAEGLHGVKETLDQMAAVYEEAEAVNTVRT